MVRLLDSIDTPHDLRKLDRSQLPQVAQEIRDQVIDVVSQLGRGAAVVDAPVERPTATSPPMPMGPPGYPKP